ncbi:MAG: DUF3857 domain-containing protein, partial [Planctomycetota bacterium]
MNVNLNRNTAIALRVPRWFHLGILPLVAWLIGPAIVLGDGTGDLQDRIKRAGGADDYPGANSVVVLDDLVVSIDKGGLATTDRTRVIKILRDAGIKDNAVAKFDFDPNTNRFQIRGIKIHRADGVVTPVALSDVKTVPAPAGTIFWGSMFQTVDLPRLHVGDSLQIVTSKTGFNLAYLASESSGPVVGAQVLEPPMPGHWHDTVYFQEGIPIIEKRYQVRAPRNKPIQYEICHGGLATTVRFEGDETIYTFVGKDMPVIQREPRMEATSDVATKLVLTTVQDWVAKSKWFHDANINQFDPTPEIESKVAEIIKGIDDPTEKIRAINCWVADNIRYVGTTRGPCEGYTMHRADETF